MDNNNIFTEKLNCGETIRCSCGEEETLFTLFDKDGNFLFEIAGLARFIDEYIKYHDCFLEVTKWIR